VRITIHLRMCIIGNASNESNTVFRLADQSGSCSIEHQAIFARPLH
jgi:predicted RNA-binding protein YlxR (DUF448 family)